MRHGCRVAWPSRRCRAACGGACGGTAPDIRRVSIQIAHESARRRVAAPAEPGSMTTSRASGSSGTSPLRQSSGTSSADLRASSIAGIRQARAAGWVDRAAAELTDTEREFLSASDELARRESARRRGAAPSSSGGPTSACASPSPASRSTRCGPGRGNDGPHGIAARGGPGPGGRRPRHRLRGGPRERGRPVPAVRRGGDEAPRDTIDTRSNLLSVLNEAGPLVTTARDVLADGIACPAQRPGRWLPWRAGGAVHARRHHAGAQEAGFLVAGWGHRGRAWAPHPRH